MKKRFFLAALLLALTFLACGAVALADDGIEVPPTELISDNPDFSIVDWHLNVMPLADDEFKLTRMTASIALSDSTHIGVRGVTQASKSCWLIGGYMTIQQWKNNAWNNYTSVSYSARGTNEASVATTVSVASGYYYRLLINHYANHDDGNAYGTTATKSVLVN